MTKEFSDIRIRPDLSEWADLLQRELFQSSVLNDLRTAARRRLVKAAEQFVIRLGTLGDEAGLPLSEGLLTGDPDTQPLVMTGHQPVIFHSGIVFKYHTAEAFAVEQNAIGVSIVIDTDQGDAGQFAMPHVEPDHGLPVLAVETLGNVNSLYMHGQLKSSHDLTRLAERVADQLQQAGQTAAARQAHNVLMHYAQFRNTDASVMNGNLLMRWRHGIGARLLELPLSAVASFPETLRLTADILKQPRRFAVAYNSALQMFREEHHIRNAANPFPDLHVSDKRCELPFWVIHHTSGQRAALEVEVDGNVTRLLARGELVDTLSGSITAESLEPMLLQNIQLVPRGALITAFLRLLFADLFVHGTGGGRYDQFTDEFVRTWWNVEPPPYTIATASRYLFQDHRKQLLDLERIRQSLRDLQYNPQRYFGTGIFSDQLEAELKELIAEKEALVAELKEQHSRGLSAKDIGHRLQQVTNAIKQRVVAEFEPQLQTLQTVTAEEYDAVNCRTYPWFFFETSSPSL